MKQPLKAEYLRTQARILIRASEVAKDMEHFELWDRLQDAIDNLLNAADEAAKGEESSKHS